MTGLKAFNLLADCVSYCHENFVCYQTDPIADSLLLSIDINNDSFLTYKRVKQKLYPSAPTQCYLANCEILQYRWMLFLDLLSEFENDDSGIAVKTLFC